MNTASERIISKYKPLIQLLFTLLFWGNQVWAFGDDDLQPSEEGGSLVGSASTDGVLPAGTGGRTSVSGLPTGALLDTGVLVTKGEVWVWGYRGSGQQGNGADVVSHHKPPARVETFIRQGVKIKTVAGGAYHIIALDENGDVWGWGLNARGETGCGRGESPINTPCRVLTGKNIIQIGAGEYTSIALGADGQVYTWGSSTFGQRGDGTDDTNLPKGVPYYEIPQSRFGGEKVRLVEAGYETSYAITESGNLYGWGDNEACQIGKRKKKDDEYKDRCPYGFLTTEKVTIPRLITSTIAGQFNGNDVVYIGAGNGWVEVLLKDGTVWGLGMGASLGLTPDGHTYEKYNSPVFRQVPVYNVAQLYARYVGSVALTYDGKLYTWGQTLGSAFKSIYGIVPTERTPASGGPIKGFGAGKEHLYYWTFDNKAYAVGYGAEYKLDDESVVNIPWPGKEITFLNIEYDQ